MFNYLIIFILLALLNNILLKKFVNIAKKLNIISKPKIKDSHKNDTPKGGGIILFFTITLYTIICLFYNDLDTYYYLFLIALPLISIFSFLDDIYDYRWFYKLTIDAVTIVIISSFLYYNFENFLNKIEFFIFYPLILFASLWFINLINFTDGSDGYLAIFTVYCFTLNSVYTYINYENIEIMKLFFIMILINFLIYNLEPAKLFLGDVGSRLISVIFLINIFFDYIKYDIEALVVWGIILLPILLDTGFTLIQRLIKKNLLSRHRDHAYQILANNFNHNKSIIWISINYLLFILPSILLFLFNLIDLKIIIVLLIIIFSFQIFYIKFKYDA